MQSENHPVLSEGNPLPEHIRWSHPIRYPDPLIKPNDTIKLDLEENKVVEFIKSDVGKVVMVTGGRNRGRVGVIKNREKHKGSFETIHILCSRLGKELSHGFLFQRVKVLISLPLLRRLGRGFLLNKLLRTVLCFLCFNKSMFCFFFASCY